MSKPETRFLTEIPSLNQREVQQLAAFQARPYLVLSIYLNADGRAREPGVVRSQAHALLHQARMELESRWDRLAHAVREAARADLERCRAFVDSFLPHGACRGLAVFSCAGRHWWQHFSVPRPVPDRILWDFDPLVLPAVRLLEDYPQTGVVLLDWKEGRYFGSRLGEVEELRVVRDEVPGRVRVGSWYGLADKRIERHIEDHVRRHVQHVAAEARRIFEAWPITWLLVGGNAELFEDFRHCLVYTLRQRWAKELKLPAHASLEEVREAVLAAEQELEHQRETALLQQLYDEWRAGAYGVVGVAETLRALAAGEVQTLISDASLQRPGFRCETCGSLSEAGDRCPLCGATSLRACADLVDEAIEDTLAQGGQAEVVGDQEEFRRDGGLGALLRFRLRPATGTSERAMREGAR